jgi:hypothetical protein
VLLRSKLGTASAYFIASTPEGQQEREKSVRENVDAALKKSSELASHVPKMVWKRIGKRNE